MLRCWRCRKYIANSVCLAKCHGKGLSEVSIVSGGGLQLFPVQLVLNKGEVLDLPSLIN